MLELKDGVKSNFLREQVKFVFYNDFNEDGTKDILIVKTCIACM